MAKRKKKWVQGPPSSPEPGASSQPASADGQEPRSWKSTLSPSGLVRPQRGRAEATVHGVELVRRRRDGETLRQQGTRPNPPA